MIGRGSSLYSRMGIEQETSSDEEDTNVSSPVTPDSQIRSRALSLEEGSSKSSLSFTCRSARRIERQSGYPYEDGDASSFGSLAGWGVICNGEDGQEVVERGGENHETGVGSDERAFSSPNACCAPHSAWPAVSSSFTEQTSDSYGSFLRYIGTADIESSSPTMSEEQFDALPDWSDVEDDPEYDTFFVKQPVSWSSTASSSASDPVINEDSMASRRAYELSGYPRSSMVHSHESPTSLVPETVERASVTGRGEKRKQLEPDELGSASKRVKRTVERRRRRRRRLPTATTRVGRHGGLTPSSACEITGVI